MFAGTISQVSFTETTVLTLLIPDGRDTVSLVAVFAEIRKNLPTCEEVALVLTRTKCGTLVRLPNAAPDIVNSVAETNVATADEKTAV